VTARQAAALLPSTPGVYRFRDGRSRVLYVGRAVDLRRRVGSYWRDLRDRRHLTPMVARIDRIEAVGCDSAHEAAWLERNLLEQTLPRWNRTRGGQEVPMYLCLDARPTTPGIRAVHLPSPAPDVVHFGPYLGGEKVRLALSALHRALPLAYAGTGGTGAERDLAAKRGVGPADRDRLADAVIATLNRDPAASSALRTTLLAHRDRATERLAFERAAQIQAELLAVEWILSPQRVTGCEPTDADVAGWADGVLVRFQIRAGRMRTWTQRACTAANARRHLAASPADWAGFAQRNAALAARLSIPSAR
jgi:excinuclease ABC subunit C